MAVMFNQQHWHDDAARTLIKINNDIHTSITLIMHYVMLDSGNNTTGLITQSYATVRQYRYEHRHMGSWHNLFLAIATRHLYFECNKPIPTKYTNTELKTNQSS